MLELSDWGYRTTKIDILRALLDQVDYMQEQKGNGSRETELLKNEQKTSATYK